MGRWKGNDLAKWERRESGEVGRCEVYSFIQGWGKQYESKILFFFMMLIKGTKGMG